MDERNNEIELIDILNIIWKRKWLIIFSTLALMIIAGTLGFILPKKWDISMVFEPSHLLSKNGGGKWEELVFTAPMQIVGQINEKSYESKISEELKIEREAFPKVKAINILNTNLIRISIREKDREKAKSILHSLYSFLKTNLDKKAEIEIKGIDTKIKSLEIEISRVEKEIQTYINNLTITKKRKKELEGEMNETRKRVQLLENDQRTSLNKENRSEAEGFTMLLYSNEIQLSLRYVNTLNELLNSKKLEEESLNLFIANNRQEIKQLENEIASFNELKGRIDNTELTKDPTSSLNPVFPQKKLFVLIAFLFGLIIFTLLAFFLEYLENQKLQG